MCVLFAVLLVNVAVVGVEIFLEAPCLPLLPKLTHSSQHLVFSVEMSALSTASAEAVDATAVYCFYLGGWRLCEGHPYGTAGAHPSNNVGYCTRSLGSVVQSHLRWRGTRGSLLGRPATTPFAIHSLQQERRGWKDRSTRPLTDLASYNARSDWCRTRHVSRTSSPVIGPRAISRNYPSRKPTVQRMFFTTCNLLSGVRIYARRKSLVSRPYTERLKTCQTDCYPQLSLNDTSRDLEQTSTFTKL